jgi:hypothetical protein
VGQICGLKLTDRCIRTGFADTAFFLGKSAFLTEGAANCAATTQKIRENPDGDTGFAVANGQAVAGREAATGQTASETSGRMARPTTGRSRRTARQPLSANTDIADTQTP